MEQLAKLVPQLYDNPDITPRSKWFSHANYGRNSQMPPYHVHFREELQQVISYLYQAYQQQQQQQEESAPLPPPTNKKLVQSLKRVSALFQGSMRGLQGHVSIEEYMCFPKYASTFPTVNIRFLYDDHEELHKAEHDVQVQLSKLVETFSHSPPPQRKSSSSSSVDDDDDESRLQHVLLLTTTLQSVLDFDDLLLAHLGEEEEIVVPMSLTEKRIVF
jgi:hypothetical protein